MRQEQARMFVEVYRALERACQSKAQAYPADWLQVHGMSLSRLIFAGLLQALPVMMIMDGSHPLSPWVGFLSGLVFATSFAGLLAMFWIMVRWRRYPHVPRWAHRATPMTDGERALFGAITSIPWVNELSAVQLMQGRTDAYALWWVMSELSIRVRSITLADASTH